MRVTHLYHSGFLLEFKQRTLLFDWYPISREMLAHDLGLIRPDRKLYVFVSHAHADHYVPVIWQLAEHFPECDTTYIVDAPISHNAPPELDLDVVACEPEQIYEIDEGMEVTTLNSTDEGLAFGVDVDGRTI